MDKIQCQNCSKELRENDIYTTIVGAEIYLKVTCRACQKEYCAFVHSDDLIEDNEVCES